jgi:starvation-inducible DNA-binding protein
MTAFIDLGVDIGISETQRKHVAEGLGPVLADTYTLAIKTHNYHWNVTGPLFLALHKLFDTQYHKLTRGADDLAERIRTLGHVAPGSMQQFTLLATVREETGTPTAEGMIEQLTHDHETAARTARKAISIAQSSGDEVTPDLLVERMRWHEKEAWKLRSLLR